MNVPLSLDGISLRVTDGTRDRYVLQDVDVTVSEGELLAVMGPSGSGKTSLVNVACGLVEPTTGSVKVFEQQAPRRARRWWAERRRRDIGVIYQRLNLVPGLTALENVALPLELDGRPAGAARTEARRALEQVGLDGWSNVGQTRLSVGEQQLVAIARGIVGDRRILLVDEPTVALDRAGADRVVRLLSRLGVVLGGFEPAGPVLGVGLALVLGVSRVPARAPDLSIADRAGLQTRLDALLSTPGSSGLRVAVLQGFQPVDPGSIPRTDAPGVALVRDEPDLFTVLAVGLFGYLLVVAVTTRFVALSRRKEDEVFEVLTTTTTTPVSALGRCCPRSRSGFRRCWSWAWACCRWPALRSPP